jgi:hypothetical protein
VTALKKSLNEPVLSECRICFLKSSTSVALLPVDVSALTDLATGSGSRAVSTPL